MSPIILVEDCLEDGEVIERYVRPFVLTPENAIKLWEEAKKFPHIFNNVDTSTLDNFLDSFFHWNPSNSEAVAEGLFWVVDDFVGVFYLTQIYHPDDALMHFTFFDKRLRGREKLIRRMIEYVFDTYEFHRLSAEIPAFASKSVLKFINQKVGLSLEGKKAQAIPHTNGVERSDLLLYGITRGDVKVWVEQRQKLLEEAQQPH